jgi:alkanesulfonate monooxygenase SsuD/methylene tetrahydromethanopterin reductase-like flavin-dependent oxidoreductase (luciferase family)
MLGRVGLNLMLAIAAPHDDADLGGGRAAERRRRASIRLHPGRSVVVGSTTEDLVEQGEDRDDSGDGRNDGRPQRVFGRVLLSSGRLPVKQYFPTSEFSFRGLRGL